MLRRGARPIHREIAIGYELPAGFTESWIRRAPVSPFCSETGARVRLLPLHLHAEPDLTALQHARRHEVRRRRRVGRTIGEIRVLVERVEHVDLPLDARASHLEPLR